MLRVAITGHRPPKIGGYDPDTPLRKWVREQLRKTLDEIRPNLAYSGMALGTDQDFAEIVLEMGIPLIVVLPFRGQEDSWPEQAQFHYWRLVHQARQVITVCEPGYAAWKMQRRNERLVDEIEDGTLIAVWDGSTGGTANCVKYAQLCQNPIIRIDPTQFPSAG
jgi:uncharacterized phage-like protein YoqJ